METILISEEDAITFLNKDEDHFFDVTAKNYSGEAVQKKCVAFANSDGGELLIGILDKGEKNLSGGIFERWSGFDNIEKSNNTIVDICNGVKPGIPNIFFEFLLIKGHEELGRVLKVFIEKSPNVHQTSSGNVYIRKGAQCLHLKNPDQITSLKLSKGEYSYENQRVEQYPVDRLVESEELESFLRGYSPKTDSVVFLKKQLLVSTSDEKMQPIYAGVLLYDENPSVVLPKKCAIKIVRYDTTEQTPERAHLKQQETVEGPLYKQAKESIDIVLRIIESIPLMGPTGLVRAKYPKEAIQEILVNAIIHRDYNISDDVIIYIFNNRIEVHSPGSLPGHITEKNILDERFSRNAKIVRLLNKYPDRPNKDIGEGLNTAFQKMREVRLKDPIILAQENRVVIVLPHEELASPEEQILQYLETHREINNTTAREITNIKSEGSIQKCFAKLRKRGLITLCPEKRGASSSWIKCDDENANEDFVEKDEKKSGQKSLF